MITAHLLDTLLQRKARLDTARETFACLSQDERQQLLSELIDQLDLAPGIAPTIQETPVERMKLRQGRPTRVDRAEAFIHTHPGARLMEIAKAIDQKPATATSTLRYLQGKRHTIVRRDRRWYPLAGLIEPVQVKASPQSSLGASKASTYREAILTALAGGEALGAMELFEAVRVLMPRAVYRSVSSEIKRMYKAHRLASRGAGLRGRLYGLPMPPSTNGVRPSGFYETRRTG